MWVQLVSCQLIGLLFAAWTPDEIVEAHSSSSGQDFIQMDSIHKVLIHLLLNQRFKQLIFCDPSTIIYDAHAILLQIFFI
jgi:hypothetical protein